MTASAQSPDLPYNTYFYVDEQIKECPATLSPETVISGSTAGTGDWNAPQDIYAANDLLYISDTDNNRVVILNMDYIKDTGCSSDEWIFLLSSQPFGSYRLVGG